MAVTVADSWQRQGLGTQLLRRLAGRAAEVGISHFTADILTDNAPTLELVRRMGPADLTGHGPTVTARMDATEWQAPDDGARPVLRSLARANVVLVPRLLRAWLDLSTELTRTLVVPVTTVLGRSRRRAG
jgi:hypothetical protein